MIKQPQASMQMHKIGTNKETKAQTNMQDGRQVDQLTHKHTQRDIQTVQAWTSKQNNKQSNKACVASFCVLLQMGLTDDDKICLGENTR